MKKELKFIRDSSTSLSHTDQLFKIQITLPTKKHRDKTAAEFADAIKTYFEKAERVKQTILIHMRT